MKFATLLSLVGEFFSRAPQGARGLKFNLPTDKGQLKFVAPRKGRVG